jgi:hypothetical protein
VICWLVIDIVVSPPSLGRDRRHVMDASPRPPSPGAAIGGAARGRPPLDLAVQHLVGDLGQRRADRAGRNPLQGGAGRVDLGLGGAAGLGQGG